MIREVDNSDWIIVDAGSAGAVLADRLARIRSERVLVVEHRDHVAGNALDLLDDAGIRIHQYGPHILQTDSRDVFEYPSQFTAWRPCWHRVLGQVDGQLVPIPINLDMAGRLRELDLTGEGLEARFAARTEPMEHVGSSEDVILSPVGRELYEKFFQGYTRKQRELDPSELDRAVTARVPVRNGQNGRYFADRFQAVPRDAYTAMFARTFCRIEEEHPLPLQRRKPGLPERNRMAAPDMDL